MLLYYITDRKSLPGTEVEQRRELLRRIAMATEAGVDYVQLREKDLSPRELERLAHQVALAIRDHSANTQFLINGRADVALACGADGVHLPAGELAASEVRALWMRCSTRPLTIGVSAHTPEEVRYAEAHGADFAVLAPIFEKAGTPHAGIGLASLTQAVARTPTAKNTESVPGQGFCVLALGGITISNALSCIQAGASGIAGIRLFQQGDVGETVRRMRAL